MPMAVMVTAVVSDTNEHKFYFSYYIFTKLFTDDSSFHIVSMLMFMYVSYTRKTITLSCVYTSDHSLFADALLPAFNCICLPLMQITSVKSSIRGESNYQ